MAEARQIERWCGQLTLAREERIPLHRQLSSGIESLIASGTLSPGDRLPNIEDLSKLCGVSKSTAVQAVGDLRRRGLLTSKRCKGTHIANPVQKTTEVLVGAIDPGNRTLSDLVAQIVEGLADGQQNPRRRIVSTFLPDDTLNTHELLDVANVRRTDSLVAYRPAAGTHEALRAAAEHMPCVSLIIPIPDSRADCLVFDVENAMMEVLDHLLADGPRPVVYAGHLSVLASRDGGPHCPYAGLYETARKRLEHSGIPLQLLLSPALQPGLSASDMDALLARRAGEELEPGSLVIAQTGTLAQRLAELGKGFELVTYTEGRRTLQACRGRMTVIYGGLELLGRAAAQTLRARIEAPDAPGPGLVRVMPRIEMPGQPGAAPGDTD